MSSKRKVLPCCPRCIFQEQTVLKYTFTYTSPHQTAQLGKKLFRYPASLISLNVVFLSFSSKDVDIQFIRKNNTCDNSKECSTTYSTLTMHFLRPFTFFTQLWTPTSSPLPLSPVWSEKSNPTAAVSEVKGFQPASRESHTSVSLPLTSSPRSSHSSKQLRTGSEQHYCLQQEDKRKQREW